MNIVDALWSATSFIPIINLFFQFLVIPDDEYETEHSFDTNYYYQDFIGDHTRIIGGSIVSMAVVEGKKVKKDWKKMKH